MCGEDVDHKNLEVGPDLQENSHSCELEFGHMKYIREGAVRSHCTLDSGREEHPWDFAGTDSLDAAEVAVHRACSSAEVVTTVCKQELEPCHSWVRRPSVIL